uniref:Uncharacterized protein n=1 Tax=Rhizophora mucronata TaxID=61149 RepID=A0A2P2K876_RHIMU
MRQIFPIHLDLQLSSGFVAYSGLLAYVPFKSLKMSINPEAYGSDAPQSSIQELIVHSITI